jgi:hypothetical protein
MYRRELKGAYLAPASSEITIVGLLKPKSQWPRLPGGSESGTSAIELSFSETT